ncbi:DUF2461 domain-containing protein [Cognatishimia sp. WU-CL00825]|uniref:TIGR02453 family protein n=1 Tax=Cognatishimia sp. WU-CL00825 TaxID=3127658 RepID=UPI0031062B80
MSDAFSQLIPETRAFLKALEKNNNRDWFLDHKDRYDSNLKRPAELLLDQAAYDLGKITGDPVKTKLFRPHRDVRFSKDKTPYHLHLHMLWTTDTGGRQPLGWFFGIGLDYISIGGGLMGFEKQTLLDWRAAVDGPAGQGFDTLMDDLASQGFRIAEPELKRVPAPYAKDHPQAALLRRKSLSAWQDFDTAELGAPTAALATVFQRLTPLMTKLKSLL